MDRTGSVNCDRCRSPLPANVPEAVASLSVQTFCPRCALGGKPERRESVV